MLDLSSKHLVFLSFQIVHHMQARTQFHQFSAKQNRQHCSSRLKVSRRLGHNLRDAFHLKKNCHICQWLDRVKGDDECSLLPSYTNNILSTVSFSFSLSYLELGMLTLQWTMRTPCMVFSLSWCASRANCWSAVHGAWVLHMKISLCSLLFYVSAKINLSSLVVVPWNGSKLLKKFSYSGTFPVI